MTLIMFKILSVVILFNDLWWLTICVDLTRCVNNWLSLFISSVRKMILLMYCCLIFVVIWFALLNSDWVTPRITSLFLLYAIRTYCTIIIENWFPKSTRTLMENAMFLSTYVPIMKSENRTCISSVLRTENLLRWSPLIPLSSCCWGGSTSGRLDRSLDVAMGSGAPAILLRSLRGAASATGLAVGVIMRLEMLHRGIDVDIVPLLLLYVLVEESRAFSILAGTLASSFAIP